MSREAAQPMFPARLFLFAFGKILPEFLIDQHTCNGVELFIDLDEIPANVQLAM